MPVTLQFIGDGGSLFGQMIEWMSAGEVCHVDAVVGDNLVGAQMDPCGGCPSGVYDRPPSYVDGCVRYRVTLPATPEQETEWLAFLRAQYGKPYDRACIAGFVAGRDWHDPNAWICSELQAAALEAAGIIRPLFAHANKITPEALLIALSALAPVECLP